MPVTKCRAALIVSLPRSYPPSHLSPYRDGRVAVGLRTLLGLKRPPKVGRAWLSTDALVSESPASAGLTADLVQLIRPIGTLMRGGYDRNNALHFMVFAAAIAKECKSQIYQDAWALWATGAKRNGYFVEFGAADGVSGSNTYMLEKKFGWKGILAEPNRTHFPRIREKRNCYISDKCVFSRSGETLSFMATKLQGLSRIASIDPEDEHESVRADHTAIMVETIGLNDLLAEAGAPRKIDYNVGRYRRIRAGNP